NKNYLHVETLLETVKDEVDILFIQEPPWRLIRRTVSSSNTEGDPVIGAPLHPDWVSMVRSVSDTESPPRVMAFVHNRLRKLRPSFCRDIFDHRDIMVLSLFPPSGAVHLMNVYSDDDATAI